MTASRVEVQIRADDPAFDGHFPGLPILPGVVLLAEVLGAIERTTGQSLGALTIRSAKFHAPVSPAPPAPPAPHPEAGPCAACRGHAWPLPTTG